MSTKKLRNLLAISSLCLLITGSVSPAHAAISKTSKRVLRRASPPLIVVPGFTAAALSTASIQWSWSTGPFTGSGIDGYHLYSSSTSQKIDLSLGTSYYIDSELGVNKQYTRWITSYQGSEQGSDSEHIEKYTFALPPDEIVLGTITATSVYITWDFSTATAYEIQCSTNGGTDYTHNRAAFVPWQTIPLISNKNYLIRMGAINGDGEVTPGIYSVSQSTITPPLTPSLSAVAISSYTIEWRWSADIFAATGITSYRIYRSTTTSDDAIPADGYDGEIVQEIAGVDSSSWTETFTDGSAPSANSRHTRWIKAVGILESQGSPSFQKFTYAIAPATCAPLFPDFKNVSETAVKLNWDTDWLNSKISAGVASKYVVDYSTAADFTVSLTSSIVSAPPSSVTGLTPNTKYDFRIGAINGDNEQTPSNAENPLAYSEVYKVLTRPPAPPSLAASAVTDTVLKWSWSTGTYTNMDYLGGYIIGIASHTAELGDFVLPIDYIPGTSASEYDLDYLLTNSTHTRYVGITQTCPGIDCPGYASFGSDAIGQTGATFATPPNDVSFDTVTSRTAGVWWKEPEVPATQYRVERSTTIGEKGPWVFVSSVSGANFNDTGLSPSTTYSYRIGAINKLGILTLGLAAATDGNRRDYSFVSSTITKHIAPVFSGAAISTSSIKWEWTNSVPGVLSFNITTSTDGMLAPNLAAGDTYWVEVNLSSANTRYARRIRSTTSSGESEFAGVSAVTLANAPSGVALSGAGAHSLSIEWSGNGGSRYRIDRSPDGAAWTTLKSWNDVHVSTSFSDSGLLFSTSYYYAILGYNEEAALSLSSAASGAFKTLELPAGMTLIFSSATVTQSGTAVLPGLGQVKIGMPPGAVPVDGYISISTNAATNPAGVSKSDLDAATAKLPPSRLADSSIVELYLYDLYGSPFAGDFSRPARITITYTDADNDDILDGIAPQLKVPTLKLFNLDTAALEWKAVRNSMIDRAAKAVYADAAHFSIYAIGSYIPAAAGSTADVFAYPNPYKPGSGGNFDQSALGEGIVFESLPQKAKIRIFNIAGGLVADLNADDGTGRFRWNARNGNGTRVASGLYIYLVTNIDDPDDKKSGKITIIK